MRVSKDARLPSVVVGDATALLQVLLNLGSNGLKFSSQPITIRVSASEKVVCIAVEDKGPGIPEVSEKSSISFLALLVLLVCFWLAVC